MSELTRQKWQRQQDGLELIAFYLVRIPYTSDFGDDVQDSFVYWLRIFASNFNISPNSSIVFGLAEERQYITHSR